jgi:aldehyde dehydrogenase
MHTLLERVQPRIETPFRPVYGNFIGGTWVPPMSGRYFDNRSPIDGQPICQIPRSDSADVGAALDAAHAVKDKWAAVSPAERANILNRIAQRMEDNLELLAVAETWDNGKPIRETKNADIPLAIDHFRYFAGDGCSNRELQLEGLFHPPPSRDGRASY